MAFTSLAAAWYPTTNYDISTITVTAVSIVHCFSLCIKRWDCGGFLWTVSILKCFSLCLQCSDCGGFLWTVSASRYFFSNWTEEASYGRVISCIASRCVFSALTAEASSGRSACYGLIINSANGCYRNIDTIFIK